MDNYFLDLSVILLATALNLHLSQNHLIYIYLSLYIEHVGWAVLLQQSLEIQSNALSGQRWLPTLWSNTSWRKMVVLVGNPLWHSFRKLRHWVLLLSLASPMIWILLLFISLRHLEFFFDSFLLPIVAKESKKIWQVAAPLASLGSFPPETVSMWEQWRRGPC